MSKFILVNNSSLLQARIRNERYGYEIAGHANFNNFELMVFHKLKINDINFLSINNDYVFITGTLLYKNLRGKELLEQIYQAYLEKGDAIRDQLMGNYAVIIKHQDIITIFGEETYFYNIFYYNQNGEIVVSNDLYDIFQHINGLEVDKHNLLEQVFLNGVVGNETVLKDVYRLSGDQKIVININDKTLQIGQMSIDWKRKNLSYEQSVSDLASNLQNVATSIKDTYNSTAICMTGGLDSRLSFASLMSAGANPSLYYGKGNSFFTNTHRQDYEICKLFSSKFNLPLTQMDWNTPNPIDKFWDYYLGRYGVLYHAYASSGHVMSSLENIKEEYVTLGQVGELFRTLEFTESRKRFTVEDYVDEYYLPKNDAATYIEKHCDNFSAFRNRLIEKYTNVCRRFNLDPNNMVVEDFFYLNLEYRANADNVMLNLINRMRYCSWLLGTYPVIKLANVSVDYLRNSHYMICAIEKLCPECLEIPVFSHEHEMVFKKNKKVLDHTAKYKFKRFVSWVTPVSLRKRLKSLIVANKEDKNNKESRFVFSKEIDEYGYKAELDLSSPEVRLIQFMYALKVNRK